MTNPMILDDSQGCPGYTSRISGRTAAICYGCARHEKPGDQLTAEAKAGPDGAWDCVNRRSVGHVQTVPANGQDVQSAVLGAVSTFANTAPEGVAA